MHCPAMFREERLEVLQQLMREHPLATLITAGAGGLTANLIPFSLHGDVLRAHLARNNKQLDDLLAGTEALIVFQGPQSYITPSWYPSKAEHGKVVPTWNFVMVQARGIPQVMDDAAWLREQVGQMTANLEGQRAEPWSVADAPDDFIATQLRAIVGVEIPIRSLEGKWKISQNRNEADRQGVIQGLSSESRCPEMHRLMAP
ncbi:negative transcriptional regulator, PaiB family [Duganella sp. CF402]|uniref:FMN-binding negative transcriptional regulator n=1 Tax=unclassified Duganella TaxID=2636909 RepID=UPI0008C567DA|nr:MULTISPECIES: FMN-binding negative transcriptional regulator [unclassified Duganella]RZT11233.1 PaiB family negative transcriptional regulator [Duganella sp. BK701]SEK75061.1 negative transcriptional regulator, PaiB family [Duganella sp. CF402]